MSLLLALLPLAFAQENTDKGRVPMEVGLRVRGLSVPDSIVDSWAYSEDDADPAPLPRPKVRGMAFGLEYALVQPQTTWIFYLERFSNRTEAGYWDDVDDGEIDHDDGRWIDPSDNFGLIDLGVNTGRDFPVTNHDKPVWLAVSLSGGLGVGFLTGELAEWLPGQNLTDDTVLEPDCLPDSVAYDRYGACGDDGSVRIPKVLPLIDGNLGLKLNFPYGYLRLEGGLHDAAYWGVAGGGHF